MRHDDIRDGVWIIRSDRFEKGLPRQTDGQENGEPGRLKLNDMAPTIIQNAPRVDANPHVFPAARGTRGLRSLYSKKRLVERMREEIPDIERWTNHDLRRTARSLMGRAGVASEIAERVLGHKVEIIEETYDRHDYKAEIGEALAKLEQASKSGSQGSVAGRRCD